MQSFSSQVGSGSRSDCLAGALCTSLTSSSEDSTSNCRNGDLTRASTNDGAGEPPVAACIVFTFDSKKSAKADAKSIKWFCRHVHSDLL